MLQTPHQLKPIHPDDLFNGYVGAHVAFTFQQIGLLDHLTPGVALSVAEIATRTGGEEKRIAALLKTGEALGYLEHLSDGTVQTTEMGEVLRTQLGYFTWSVGGYGQLFQHLPALTREQQAWGPLRNTGLVALGADLNNRNFMQHLLFEVLESMEFTTIADLGCGNGGRLVSYCQRYPHIKGVGVDISEPAIAMANDMVEQHGLEDRLKMICTNVLDTILDDKYQEVLADVEVVSSFMMLHDLYNIPGVWEVLFDRLRAAFPNVRYFLIADTVQMPPLEELEKLPIFNVGYELLHAYMDVNLPTKQEYDEAFAKAGLTVETCIDFGTPYTYLYLLRV
ncbi:MAG TPA: methyltransferase [Bacilli bacterium]|nr:methyltransferase [Bacilli bacterium]